MERSLLKFQLISWGLSRLLLRLACFNPLSLFASIPYAEALYLLLTAAATRPTVVVVVALLGIKNSGDPFAFLHAQQAGWGHQPGLNLSGLPSWQRLFSQILLGPQNSNNGQRQDLLFPVLMFVFAGLAFTAWRQQPYGSLVVSGKPVFNGAMVPLLLLIGLWASLNPRWGRLLLGFGALLCLAFGFRFASGGWVG